MAWVTGKRGAYRAQWREGGKVCSGEMREGLGDAEADKRAKESELALAGHKAKPSASMPLAALLERWRESRMASKRVRGHYAAEVKATLGAMAKLMEWKTAGDITADSFDQYRVKCGGKGTDRPLAMVKSVMGYGKRVLRLPVDEALLDLEALRVANKRQQPPLLTDAQVIAIIHRGREFGDNVTALLENMAVYGVRPVDLCRARVGDWRPDTGLLHYRDTKNGADQSKPVQAGHARRLDAICMEKVDNVFQARKPDAPLFMAPNNTPWEIDAKGSATQLTSWYRNNIGRHLLIRTGKSGEQIGCLAASQLGMYCLKDYGLSRAERLAGRRGAMALGQHKTESAFRRYLATNEDEQRAALALLPEPM